MATWEDVVLVSAEAIAAAGLILLGLRVWRAYRVVGERSLARLGQGFFLLATSQAAAILLHLSLLFAGDVLDDTRFDHFDLLFWLYYLAMLAGLAGVFWSFGRHPFRWAPALAMLLVVGPILEILTIVALFFVVLHAGLNHIARKGGGSGMVAAAFFFIFTAHTVFLLQYSSVAPRTWIGELVNLAGVGILYYSVARPRTVPDA